MRTIWLVLLGVVITGAARAQTVAAPRLHPHDTWTYQDTVLNRTGWHQGRIALTVERVESDLLAIQTQPVGSAMPPRELLIGADWSRTRSVNGHQTVVNRPLDFPLSQGKSWLVDYTEDHPNRVHSMEHFHTPYKVVGWEDVTVPAGTFHALKIEADGSWSAKFAPAVSSVTGGRVDAQGTTAVIRTSRALPAEVSGRTYKAFWYVPAVKRWVKSVEEYYDTDGVRTSSYTSELLSFKVAP